jgi:signal transduction histidine kinase
MRGAHKLMDAFRVDTTSEHGTTIEMGKTLPRSMPKMSASFLAHISSELAKAAPGGPLEEIRQQNIELLQALDDLKTRQIELDRTVHELTDAHEKLTSINLELEDKAVALQRKTAAEQLARAEAETAVALREDMLAIVSHDLRTPLASIVASAAVIEGSADHEGPEWRERTRKSSAIIMRSAYRMRRLIADLLDLAQIRTGKMMIHHDDVRAEALIEESLDTVQALATQGELSLSGTSPTTLWVRCDKERVLQILSNLLSNAIKFTPGGGSVTVDAQESGREALFIVADTGQGMSKDDLPHIFNRFWQAEKRNSAGIGLGLSIVAGLVEAHGGRVWAEAAVGSGSRFFFTLPLAQTSHIG